MNVGRHCLLSPSMCTSHSRVSELNDLASPNESVILSQKDKLKTVHSIMPEYLFPTMVDVLDIQPAPLSDSVSKNLCSKSPKNSLVRHVSFHSSNGDDNDWEENFLDELLSLDFMSDKEMMTDCSEKFFEPMPLKESSLLRVRSETNIEIKIKRNENIPISNARKSPTQSSSESATSYTLQWDNEIRDGSQQFHHSGAIDAALSDFDKVVLPSFREKTLHDFEAKPSTYTEMSGAMENLRIKHKKLVVSFRRVMKRSQKSQKKVLEIEKKLHPIYKRHFDIIRESAHSRKEIIAFTRK